MKYTKKCIVCLKKACIWGGHVVGENNKPIIVGWCKEHHTHPNVNLMNRIGCYGAWHKRYGLIEKL